MLSQSLLKNIIIYLRVTGENDEEIEYDPRKAPKLEFEEDSMLEVGTGAVNNYSRSFFHQFF